MTTENKILALAGNALFYAALIAMLELSGAADMYQTVVGLVIGCCFAEAAWCLIYAIGLLRKSK